MTVHDASSLKSDQSQGSVSPLQVPSAHINGTRTVPEGNRATADQLTLRVPSLPLIARNFSNSGVNSEKVTPHAPYGNDTEGVPLYGSPPESSTSAKEDTPRLHTLWAAPASPRSPSGRNSSPLAEKSLRPLNFVASACGSSPRDSPRTPLSPPKEAPVAHRRSSFRAHHHLQGIQKTQQSTSVPSCPTLESAQDVVGQPASPRRESYATAADTVCLGAAATIGTVGASHRQSESAKPSQGDSSKHIPFSGKELTSRLPSASLSVRHKPKPLALCKVGHEVHALQVLRSASGMNHDLIVGGGFPYDITVLSVVQEPPPSCLSGFSGRIFGSCFCTPDKPAALPHQGQGHEIHPRKIIKAHSKTITDLQLSTDTDTSLLFSAGADCHCHVWSTQTWKKKSSLGFDRGRKRETGPRGKAFGFEVLALSTFQQHTSWLAISGADRIVRLWDVDADTELLRFLPGDTPLKTVSCAESLLHVGDKAGGITVWDMRSGAKQVGVLGHNGRSAHQGRISCLVSGTYGKPELFSSAFDCLIKRWDVRMAGNEPLTVYRGHKGIVRAVEPSPSVLLSCSMNSTVRVWDRVTGENFDTFITPEWPNVLKYVTPDIVAFASKDRTVSLWEAPTTQGKDSVKRLNHISCVTDPMILKESGMHDKTFVIARGGIDGQHVVKRKAQERNLEAVTAELHEYFANKEPQAAQLLSSLKGQKTTHNNTMTSVTFTLPEGSPISCPRDQSWHGSEADRARLVTLQDTLKETRLERDRLRKTVEELQSRRTDELAVVSDKSDSSGSLVDVDESPRADDAESSGKEGNDTTNQLRVLVDELTSFSATVETIPIGRSRGNSIGGEMENTSDVFNRSRLLQSARNRVSRTHLTPSYT
ncbi:WD repeat-containing protein [Diplonema papillatum]|nr:WD repeat-containing protein [Diplonema papillatum]